MHRISKGVGAGKHREGGYICIWGTSPKEKVIDDEGVEMECPQCEETTRMIGKKVSPYCTCFYIPLFPEGGGEEFFECSSCGAKFQGSIGSLRSKISRAKAKLEQDLEKKQARFDENPEDIENASEMIELYMAAGREAEAIELGETIAEKHPENSNLQTVLGRAYLSSKRPSDAVAAFDRAIDANPSHPGAHFFKAVALVQGARPDVRTALDEAREAHALGYPDALGLVRALEKEAAQRGI